MFLFSLQRNGKNEMKKYNKRLNNCCYGFNIYEKSCDSFFGFGDGHYDLYIPKYEKKNSAVCKETYAFDYNGIKNALRGNNNRFTVDKIIIIQMK